MARELNQTDFDALLPKGIDLRPMVAEQVWQFLESKDYTGQADSDVAKAESLLHSVEQKGYARKQRKHDDPPGENSTPYLQMLKNWGRKDADGNPAPTGDRKFARGVFYYFFRDVPNHMYFFEITKEIWQPHELIFQRLYYAKYHDDPKAQNFSEVCARFHSNAAVVRSEFKKIWVGAPVGPPTKVHLGPVTITLDDPDGLNRLSLQEPAHQTYIADGLPDVFKALDWRSRLSGFHGRKSDADLLDNWARDKSHTSKVMLVSGPGGAGKTRLVADTVARLAHDHGWTGGFLGDASRPIAGGGAGVAIIVDYPEERTPLVAEILKAAALAMRNEERYDRPVRLILVSRETREAWAGILNQPANFIDEIRLDARPYLDLADALAIAEDIQDYYPERIGREAGEFSGVEAWLENPVHRLPLNVVAASVHAVLDPSHAFKLDGVDVLTALAEWELRRVRYYSERDLNDRGSLEKLLSLSLFTHIGLSKETIFDLGEKGICAGKSGDGLLEAVRKTPFWCPKGENPSHLLKLEPDRPAAIFCLNALRLDDPSPALPSLLAPVASQDADSFGDRLSRVAFDIAHVDPEASRTLEQQCIGMLDLKPGLANQLRELVVRSLPAFSAELAIEISRRLLQDISDKKIRALLFDRQAAKLSTLRRHSEALEAIEEAVKLYRELQISFNEFEFDLARSLANQANVLAAAHRLEESLKAVEEAVEILGKLAEAGLDVYVESLAGSLRNRAHRLIALGRYLDAQDSVEQAIKLYRTLAQTHPNIHRVALAHTLNTQAAILGPLKRRGSALQAMVEAAEVFDDLARERPEAFLPDFAMSLHNLAEALCNKGKIETGVGIYGHAVSIWMRLAEARPEIFLPDLAASLVNYSIKLGEIDRHEESLIYAEEAVRIQRRLVHVRPGAEQSGLAGALMNLARALFSELGRRAESPHVIGEAVTIYVSLVFADRDRFLPDLANSLCDMANALGALGRNEEALDPIVKAAGMYRELAESDPDAFLPHLAQSLTFQADRLAILGRKDEARRIFLKAVSALNSYTSRGDANEG